MRYEFNALFVHSIIDLLILSQRRAITYLNVSSLEQEDLSDLWRKLNSSENELLDVKKQVSCRIIYSLSNKGKKNFFSTFCATPDLSKMSYSIIDTIKRNELRYLRL